MNGWKDFTLIVKYLKFDYKPLITVGWLSQKMVDSCKERNYKKFCDEFAIMDEHNNLKPMYIDCVATEGRLAYKVHIYVDNRFIILEYGVHENIKDYANAVHNIAITKGAEIYIDICGFGRTLYDYLMEFKDLKVNKLTINK